MRVPDGIFLRGCGSLPLRILEVTVGIWKCCGFLALSPRVLSHPLAPQFSERPCIQSMFLLCKFKWPQRQGLACIRGCGRRIGPWERVA